MQSKKKNQSQTEGVCEIIRLPFTRNDANLKPDNQKEKLNIQFESMSKQSQSHLRHGELGLYACDLYDMSETHRKEQHYDKQLYALILSSYIHLSGINTLEEYNYWKSGDFSISKPQPILPPAVIRNTRNCLDKLGIGLPEYQKLFRQYVDVSLTPAHVFGIDDSIKIICAYIENGSKAGDMLISNGTKKFIKNYSKKKK